MAFIDVTSDEVVVRFSAAEKIAGLVRDQRFPRSAVVEASVLDEPLSAVKGLRAPGLGLPGLRKIGTWRGRGRTLVSVRQGQRGVRITLAESRYDALVIGLDDPERVVAGLAPASA